jgi:hypothetical protein
MILNKIVETYIDEDFLKADGLDEAVIGIDEDSMRLIYSVKKIIEILVKGGMTKEEAQEYYDFNIFGSHVGKRTPIWCDDNFD